MDVCVSWKVFSAKHCKQKSIEWRVIKKRSFDGEIFDTFIIKPKIMRVCLYIEERSMIAKKEIKINNVDTTKN